MYKSGNDMQNPSVYGAYSIVYCVLTGLRTMRKRGGRGEAFGWQQEFFMGWMGGIFGCSFCYFFEGLEEEEDKL